MTSRSIQSFTRLQHTSHCTLRNRPVSYIPCRYQTQNKGGRPQPVVSQSVTLNTTPPTGAYTTDGKSIPNRADYINCYEYYRDMPNLSSHMRTVESCKQWFQPSNKSQQKRHPKHKLKPPYKHTLENDDPNDTQYRILCSMIVERLPSVMSELHDMDGAWLALQQQRLPYTHLQLPQEAITTTTNAARTPVYIDDLDDKPDEIIDIETYDDLVDNKQSLNRALRESLFLVVKYTDESYWSFPTTAWHGISKRANDKNLTLRQTAESITRQIVGQDISIHILGNAPIAIHKQQYEKSVRAQSQFETTQKSQQYVGSKQLLFHAAYTGSARWQPQQNDLSAQIEQYAWVTKQQLQTMVKPELWPILDDALMV